MPNSPSRFFVICFALFASLSFFAVESGPFRLKAEPTPQSAQAQPVQEPTFPAPAVGASMESLRSLFITYWDWKLATQPELATRVGHTEFNDRWRDLSKRGRDRVRERRKEFLQELIYISTGNLTVSQRLSANVLQWELKNALEMETYSDLVSGVSQQGGLHSDVFSVIDQMPTRTVRDYENIVLRLNAVPTLIDQYLALLRDQVAAKQTQPQIV